MVLRREPPSRGPCAVIREDDQGPSARPTPPSGARSTVLAMRVLRAIESFGFDAIVLVALVIGGVELVALDEIDASPLLVVLTALWGLPLLFRRRFPVAAPTAALLALAAETLADATAVSASFATGLALMLAVSQFGQLGPRWEAFAGGAVGVLLVLAVVAWDEEDNAVAFPLVGMIAVFAWLIGFAFHERGRRTAELEERADRLERERESEARAAVAEERTRIAREMHDVVAHSLSVMVVQAEAAEEMLDTDPERARRPLAAVQDTGRSALSELRRMLGVLRELADEGPALAPQPGLAALDVLVEQVTAAGLPVSVRVEGEPRPLPPGIDLSAYRIVQEGLTNALRHAGPARAEVVVRYGDRELELQVSDDGRGAATANGGAGHGLVGMRERVAVYGGRLDAGPRPEGGFAIAARLPLEVLGAR